MRDKKKLLKHIDYVFNECRRYIESKNNDCLNCLEGADTCYQVHEEVKRLIQQQPEIDEKYVEEKAIRLIETFGYRFKGKHFPGHLEEAQDFVTQIISDTKGKQVEVDEAFIWKERNYIAEYPSYYRLGQAFKRAGVKIKK